MPPQHNKSANRFESHAMIAPCHIVRPKTINMCVALEQHRRLVCHDCCHNLHHVVPCPDRIEESDLTRLGVVGAHPPPPFTVIASDHIDESGHPVRQYPWGESNGYLREHSDFILLKRLMMGDGEVISHDALQSLHSMIECCS